MVPKRIAPESKEKPKVQLPDAIIIWCDKFVKVKLKSETIPQSNISSDYFAVMDNRSITIKKTQFRTTYRFWCWKKICE